MVGPVTNESRGLLDDGRANTGVTNATRGTESQLKGGKLLTQEPEFASKPGPLQLMMQMSAHAVGALMLCDQSLGGEIIGRYNEAHHNGAATVSVHDSWAGFLKQLSAYRWIETLTLLLHSRPGEFLFHPSPTGNYFQEAKSLAEAGQAFTKLNKKPKIRTVDLESCNVGLEIDSVVKFGLALGADVVTCTNKYHEFWLNLFDVAKGESAELERQFSEFEGYLVDPHLKGWIELARVKPVKRVFLLEWFVGKENYKKRLPVDKTARGGFYTVGSLRSEYVRTEQELKSLAEILHSDNAPRRITIDLSFRKADASAR